MAVANATPSTKDIAAFVTVAENGNGVIELIEELIANDLLRLEGTLARNMISLGKRIDGVPVQFALRSQHTHYRPFG